MLYANDSVLFSKFDWRRTGNGGTLWTVSLDGEFISLSDEMSAGSVGRRVWRGEHKEASEDPLVHRDLGLGRLKTLKVGLDHLFYHLCTLGGGDHF